jgi:hypothetical protein
VSAAEVLVAEAEPTGAPGSSGIRTAAAVPVTVTRLSAVDETRMVTLARTVVTAGKASHSGALKPGSDDFGKHFPATDGNETLGPIR